MQGRGLAPRPWELLPSPSQRISADGGGGGGGGGGARSMGYEIDVSQMRHGVDGDRLVLSPKCVVVF